MTLTAGMGNISPSSQPTYRLLINKPGVVEEFRRNLLERPLLAGSGTQRQAALGRELPIISCRNWSQRVTDQDRMSLVSFTP